MSSRLPIAFLLILASAAQPSASFANETKTFVYDAKGRLIKVIRTGSVNNGVTTEYRHDKADNRKKKKTTGAP